MCDMGDVLTFLTKRCIIYSSRLRNPSQPVAPRYTGRQAMTIHENEEVVGVAGVGDVRMVQGQSFPKDLLYDMRYIDGEPPDWFIWVEKAVKHALENGFTLLAEDEAVKVLDHAEIARIHICVATKDHVHNGHWANAHPEIEPFWSMSVDARPSPCSYPGSVWFVFK